MPHGYQDLSEHGGHLSLMMRGGFEAFFEEVAAIATTDHATRPSFVLFAAGQG